MNIYEKLNEARIRFQNEGFKKNGANNFAHYSYFQLKDILSMTTPICRDLKIICLISFGNDIATMKIVDCEKSTDFIEFTSPMSKATLKGCHEVQNLGAVETYIRRYLYMTAFEIEECDPSEDLDNGEMMQKQQAKPQNQQYQQQNPVQNQPRQQPQQPNQQVQDSEFMLKFEQVLMTYGDYFKGIMSNNGLSQYQIMATELQNKNVPKCKSYFTYIQKEMSKQGITI